MEALTLSVEDLYFLSDKIKIIYQQRKKHKISIVKIKDGIFEVKSLIPAVSSTN